MALINELIMSTILWLAFQIVPCHRTFHNQFPCEQSKLSRHLLECNVNFNIKTIPMQSPLKGELFTNQFIDLGCLFTRKGHNSRMTENFHYCYVLNTQSALKGELFEGQFINVGSLVLDYIIHQSNVLIYTLFMMKFLTAIFILFTSTWLLIINI